MAREGDQEFVGAASADDADKAPVEDPAIEVAAYFALDVSGQSTARGLDEPDDKRGKVDSEQLPQGGLLGAAAAVGSEWGAGASRCLLEDDRSRQSMRVLAIACEGDGHGARPSTLRATPCARGMRPPRVARTGETWFFRIVLSPRRLHRLFRRRPARPTVSKMY